MNKKFFVLALAVIVCGFLFFKMREARLTANPNEDERWFNGICK